MKSKLARFKGDHATAKVADERFEQILADKEKEERER